MIWTLLSALARPFAWLLGLFALRADAARDARIQADNKAYRDNLKAQERGRNAVADESRLGGSNDDLVKRLRERDGDWR